MCRIAVGLSVDRRWVSVLGVSDKDQRKVGTGALGSRPGLPTRTRSRSARPVSTSKVVA